MLHVRLLYEQIEAAKAHLLSGSVLGCRLALILLDNAAELMMHRELETVFGFDDERFPQWEPARTEWLQAGRGPKYTAEERKAAEREFEPKTRILCLRRGRISREVQTILIVCHKLRCEAFHRGKLRQAILGHVTTLLYTTVVDLTITLPIRAIRISGGTQAPEEAAFLERFGLDDSFAFGTDEGRRQVATRLLDGIDFDASPFSAALADDLVERIHETLQGLERVGETNDPTRIDRNLQYTQFWRQIGGALLRSGVRGPELEDAYRRWQQEGHATYTLHKIGRWRRQAEAIRRYTNAARALDHYWSVDKRLRPLEEDVVEAVCRYDEEINSRI